MDLYLGEKKAQLHWLHMNLVNRTEEIDDSGNTCMQENSVWAMVHILIKNSWKYQSCKVGPFISVHYWVW